MPINTEAVDIIIHAIETSGKSQAKIASESGISESTISRLLANRHASRPTLDILAAYFEVGEAYQKAAGAHEHTCQYAAALCAELQDTRDYYEKKAAAVRMHYEQQITMLQDQCRRQEQERSREREMQAETYDKSTAYLKDIIDRLRGELITANSVAKDISAAMRGYTHKKNRVFWVLGVSNVLLVILLYIAIRTAPLF